ncbi:MAG: hypothetical protein KBS85_06220 [Lachnospiraceae bacterium]|nr:hypothetical protein [Candidatus Merdinaster equi]
MNAAALNTVYNHYLTTYAPKGINSRFDTHKKSELRGIYNSIVKMNKEAPLAILDTSKDTQEFAVGLKEGARFLHNSLASMNSEDVGTLLNKKIAFSSDSETATAEYIGEKGGEGEIQGFTLEVKHLATPQINEGAYLNPDARTELPADSYSFDIGINNLNYEFQFNINEGDTNRDVQERLSRLVNDAGIGLSASVKENSDGLTSLELSSKATGLHEGQENQFRVSDDQTSRMRGTVDYFGLNTISTEASNAVFAINGSERNAYSNNFTIDKTYEINLLKETPEESGPVVIGLREDHEYLKNNLKGLLGSYNEFIKTASAFMERQPYSSRVINEFNAVADSYSDRLHSIGISRNQDGDLILNEDQMENALAGEDVEELLGSVKDFTESLVKKTDNVSINPMNYAHKTIVAYKNPGHGYASPYVTSAYSGMMFNSYC